MCAFSKMFNICKQISVHTENDVWFLAIQVNIYKCWQDYVLKPDITRFFRWQFLPVAYIAHAIFRQTFTCHAAHKVQFRRLKIVAD